VLGANVLEVGSNYRGKRIAEVVLAREEWREDEIERRKGNFIVCYY
jgi:hypothetical protein